MCAKKVQGIKANSRIGKKSIQLTTASAYYIIVARGIPALMTLIAHAKDPCAEAISITDIPLKCAALEPRNAYTDICIHQITSPTKQRVLLL